MSTTSTNTNPDNELDFYKELAIQVVASKCHEYADIPVLNIIFKALQQQQQNTVPVLKGMAISGGKTNYSYKIYLEENEVTTAEVFVKVCFDCALWNPDRTMKYDLARVENEFQIMKQFQQQYRKEQQTTTPIAMPYFCVDVPSPKQKQNGISSRKVKILATEWSATANREWSYQFRNGHVNTHILPRLAHAIATLHSTPPNDFDPMFNDSVRSCMQHLFFVSDKKTKEQIMKMSNNTDNQDSRNKVDTYIYQVGYEHMANIVRGMDRSFMKTRDTLIHNDTHIFNVLVDSEGEDNDDFILCDWEMSMAGPAGRDIGLFFAVPIAMAMCHAMHQNKTAAYHMMDCCDLFWNSYVQNIIRIREKQDQKENELACVFRNAMGWVFLFNFIAYYQLEIGWEKLPLDGLNSSQINTTMTSIGYAGILMGELGFLEEEDDKTTKSLEELRIKFHGIVSNEIEELLIYSKKTNIGLPEVQRQVQSTLLSAPGSQCVMSNDE